ncbi:MAG TPA: metallophosphoesterase, partial [Allosphingosinicella sp.]
MLLRRWAALLSLLIAWSLAVHIPSAYAAEAERIVAIGDLHGDHAAWRQIAAAAGLIDQAGRWAGGRAILVQTGDVTDRGPDSLKIIRDLRRLQSEAQRAGGRVIAVVGNHEAMNVTGDLRYVHPGEYAAFRG